MRNKKAIHFTFFLLTSMLMIFSDAAVAAVGSVTELKGSASAQRADEPERELSVGADIHVDDIINTAADATIKLRFADDTQFELGSNASFRVDAYDFDAGADSGGFSARVLKGAFRFVTGLVARKEPQSFQVQTAVATIGIRGTHVIGEADATSSTVILLAGEDGSVGAINVSNEFGAVDIDQADYGTEIPDEFSPPSPPRRMQMNTIQNLTRGLQNIQRMNIPRPRMP
ncbi:MAG: FecR family protein [Gammaproteobacteria bacterium]